VLPAKKLSGCLREPAGVLSEFLSTAFGMPIYAGVAMSVRTVFLARLFGLYCVIIAAAMLPQPEAFVTIVHTFVADAPLVLIAGVFTLFGGLAIVLLHNYWSGGALPVIITLLGWLTLIKAVVLLVLPSTRLVALYGGVSPTHILISGSLTLLLGIYLTVTGFRSSLDR
jgi:hypothetical protein